MKLLKKILNKVECRICVLRDYRFTPPNSAIHRHIVVFESDDWGSIRMPKREGWSRLKQLGYAVDKRPYERFDTLESPDDLELLFEVLRKHKDVSGNHPIITANMLMANPAFAKIEETGYKKYYYEPIIDTYTRYHGDGKVIDVMRQGMNEGLFMPQSHGREHFNVAQWMKGLQGRDEDLLTAFEYGMCGIAPKNHPERGNQLMNALLAENVEGQDEINDIVSEGLKLFEELWGFKSKTFVAPCYLWNEQTEEVLAEGGVELIQTARSSKPAFKSPRRNFYSGQRNKYGQFYSVRNCRFEPATNEGGESVDKLMLQIENVFKQHKIAVFSSHRINYVGGVDAKNRARTLKVLDDFLTRLLRRYPDVEFISSDKLIEIFK